MNDCATGCGEGCRRGVGDLRRLGLLVAYRLGELGLLHAVDVRYWECAIMLGLVLCYRVLSPRW